MHVGIDLGTTNSAIAYIDENMQPQIISNSEGQRTTPSVLLNEDNNFIVGSIAKETSIHEPLNTIQFVKRQIGNPVFKFYSDSGEVFSPEELSAIVLKKLKTDAETFLGKKITGAVVTVPAYFDDAQRKATQDAGKIAGLTVLKIINEPTAAALAYMASSNKENQNILVYDLGGGTFDVTVMTINNEEVAVRATDGNRSLGGFDFDNEIIKKLTKDIKDKYNLDIEDNDEVLQELREKAENAKKVLSTRQKADIGIFIQGEKIKLTITQTEFVDIVQRLINFTMLIMEDVMEEAELDWKELDKILLVGGSTRIPTVKEMIKNLTGIEPSGEVNPDEVVALGAAIQASLIVDNQSKIKRKVLDVNSHSLGVLANDEEGNIQNCIILSKNTKIPCETSRLFYTTEDEQKEVELIISEGEDEDPEYVNIIGKCRVELVPRPKGSPINILISYDENAIIKVSAIDEVDNNFLNTIEINRESNLTEKEVSRMIDKFASIVID